MFLFVMAMPALALDPPEETTFQNRIGWKIANDRLEIIVLRGGGHIVSAKLLDKNAPKVNPFWIPNWKSIDPADYDPDRHGHIYGDNHEGKLLSGIMGHNICLDFFGVPSKAEYKHGGITVHGEGPVVNWKLIEAKAERNTTTLVYGADLPKAKMHIERTITLRRGEQVARIRERLTNNGSFDRPFGWCQHVTFGAPFVEKGKTRFDIPAFRSMVAPFEFSKKMRYKMGAEFRWPYCPGIDQKIKDWRLAAHEKESSDFTTHLMDPNLSYGYFTAANPSRRLMVGYIWDRKVFPWLCNWEENHARKHIPWVGKEMTRGMEFSNTPLTYTRKKHVDMGEFMGAPTHAWIEAGDTIDTQYMAFFKVIPEDYRGTEMLKMTKNTIEVTRDNGSRFVIKCREAEGFFRD